MIKELRKAGILLVCSLAIMSGCAAESNANHEGESQLELSEQPDNSNMKVSETKEFTGQLDFTYNEETDAQSWVGQIKWTAYSPQGQYYLKQDDEMDDYLYFVDKNSGREVLVCNKSNCKHEDESCDAFFCAEIYAGTSLWYNENSLYAVAIYEGNICLEKISLDGSTRERVRDIMKQVAETSVDVEGNESTVYRHPEMQLHRGNLYYSDGYPGGNSATLWKLSMDGDENAQQLFKVEGENVKIYRIYPFGRYVFFQAGCMGDSEGNLDISLYAYDTESDNLVYLVKKDAMRVYCVYNNKLYYEDLQKKIYQLNMETGEEIIFLDQDKCPEYTEEWSFDRFFFQDDKMIMVLNSDETGNEMQIVVEMDDSYYVLKETEMIDY